MKTSAKHFGLVVWP